MRKLIVLVVLVAVIAVAAVAMPAGAATKSVRVDDDFFSPRSISVARGTTVAWRFVGDEAHNVTVTRGPVRFRSTNRRSGTYRKRLTRRGTYSILCTLHAPGMKMTVRVR